MGLTNKKNLNIEFASFDIKTNLKEPWNDDIWDLSNNDYDIYNPKQIKLSGVLNFSILKNERLKNEIKNFLYRRIEDRIITAGSIKYKFKIFNSLVLFISNKYKKYNTIIDIDLCKAIIELRTYCELKNISKSNTHDMEATLKQIYQYWLKTYDNRDEYMKDIWDIRNINPSKVALAQSKYCLKFNNIPEKYRELAKRYIKICLQRYSLGYCEKKLYGIRLFLVYISEAHNEWDDLRELNRNDIENFIVWVQKWFINRNSQKLDLQIWNVLIDVKTFIEYIQLAQYDEAPVKLVNTLIFKEDKPRKPDWKLNRQKYIPQEVLNQLEENIEYLDSKYIPIVIILRATGLRISDVLAMKYNKCLELVNRGWYIITDISKTKVINHRIPITEEVALIIKEQIEIAKEFYNTGQNPNKFLFVRQQGVRTGLPPASRSLERALNKLAKERNIVDDDGQIFHFKNHAFRHTKAVELINNGMNLLHVQKWLAHFSPEMTLKYAQLLDGTLRKSWEEIMKTGLFKVNINNGKLEQVDLSFEDNDLIEWEYIRKNLDAVRIPLGYCFKPNKVQCNHQLNPCLTCSNMCTSPEFSYEFEIEIKETKRQIERAKQLGRTVWVEKNEVVLKKLESILAILKQGKVYHKVGKQKREYVGDERND